MAVALASREPTLEIDDLEYENGDEDATLIYDLVPREWEDPPRETQLSATQPPRGARPVSGVRIAVTLAGALIGALYGAWAAQQQVLGVPPPAEALASLLGELPGAAFGTRVTVTALPPRPPARPPRAERPPSLAVTPPMPSATAPIVEPPAQPAQPSLIEPPAPRAQPARGARARSASAPAQRTGVLRINSRPWSKVFVDNRLVGSTPQTAIELAPGRHRIALISDEFALRRTLTVKVRAGQTVTRSVELLQ